MKKFILPLMVIILILSSVAVPGQGEASTTLQEINQKLEQLKKEELDAKDSQHYISNKINEIKQSKEKTSQEILDIQANIEEVIKQIEKYQIQIDEQSAELQKTGQELQDAEERVAARDELLKARVRFIYTKGAISYLDVLLSSNSFSDFIERYKLLASIANQDKKILEHNKRDRDLVAVKKLEVEKGLAHVKDLYEDRRAEEQKLNARKKDQQVLIASLDNEEKYYDDMSEEQEQILIELASQKARLIKERTQLELKYSGGKFSWPLPRDYPLTSNFGYRVDPITGAKGAFHGGLDIGAPGGTHVLAAADGMVIVSRLYGGFGYCVIIDHGDGLWTLYGHMRKGSLLVKEGETVKRGQHIGNVGQTGRATGNHLHFGVYLNNQKVDPKKYLQ